MSENKTYDRACIDQLPEKCNRKVHKSCLKPDCDKLISCMFKEKSCKKAHQRTHKGNRGNRNCKNHTEWMTVTKIYHAVRAGKGKFGYKEEIKDKGDRSHKSQLAKSGEEHAVCHCSGIQYNVVTDHGVNHEKYHDDSKDDFLKFVFWHKKSSFKMIK